MNIKLIIITFLLTSLLLAACQSAVDQQVSNLEISEPVSNGDQPSITEEANTVPESTSLEDERPPLRASQQFSTDFSIRSISFSDILSGGPPKDGIPPIDAPRFISVDEADEWLNDVEPIIQMVIEDDARAYPLQILTWHEIVNDTVGGLPVVVTFCPLCNTAIAFERTVGDEVLNFGTTGFLRYSNLLMYDRQTETWWQQATGEGLIGEFTNTQLEFVPAALISWRDFKDAYPEGQVLSRETGHIRNYGRNPYVGYDNINNIPFLYDGPDTPGQLPPVARILALEFDGETAAYPYRDLSEVGVVNDRVGNQEIAVFWAPGQASALDTSIIAEGKDVGSAIAYSRYLDDQLLTFVFVDEQIMDEETGSTWNILGQAIDGPLFGEQLTEVVSVNHLWFSWAAFKPETHVFQLDN